MYLPEGGNRFVNATHVYLSRPLRAFKTRNVQHTLEQLEIAAQEGQTFWHEQLEFAFDWELENQLKFRPIPIITVTGLDNKELPEPLENIAAVICWENHHKLIISFKCFGRKVNAKGFVALR